MTMSEKAYFFLSGEVPISVRKHPICGNVSKLLCLIVEVINFLMFGDPKLLYFASTRQQLGVAQKGKWETKCSIET